MSPLRQRGSNVWSGSSAANESLLCWCREVTAGFETLTKMEEVETTRDGIFVMPRERITIQSSYVMCERCERETSGYRSRLKSLTAELETLRSARLPGN